MAAHDMYLIDADNDIVVGPFTGRTDMQAIVKADAFARDHFIRGNSNIYGYDAINWKTGVKRMLPSWYHTHVETAYGRRGKGNGPRNGRWMFA